MQTLREFTGRVWYAQKIVIVDLSKMPEDGNIFDHALFKGENWKLQSVMHRQLMDRWVKACGVCDDHMVIQVI